MHFSSTAGLFLVRSSIRLIRSLVKILFFFFYYRSLDSEPISFTDPDIVVLVTNSNVKHELEGSEYSSRRQMCEEAAKRLGKTSLRDANISELDG